jgi:tetratricopeptide (TPR) repeat protein|tara:strand:+ start:3558 stop:4217 length:660 start_codon:yes stop_codon:yes gene_type:complete
MKYLFFYCLLVIFSYAPSFAQVTNSDRLFKMATDFVKEKKYTDAVSIFEELARNNEHDAQYNLAFLINGGKGTTKNYSEALFWAYLSKLGKIEKAEELSKDLAKIVPEKVLKDVRGKVLQHLLDRFENKDKAVLMELGDFYLLVLDERDFENAYLWYNVASALGVENSGDVRDKVEKELEPDTIIKMQTASRKRYEEFTKSELIEDEKKLENTEQGYES